MKKELFVEKFTEDKDCSLNPPNFYIGEEANNEYFNRKNRAWQSAPCVTKTKGGRIFCTFSGDNSAVGDECPNNYNILIYSDDNGETWVENAMIIDHPDSVRIHGPIMFYAPDGVLWLFWGQSYIYWDSRAGVWAVTCDNPDADTLTWSEPRRICHGVMATPPIMTKKGEFLLPVSIWKNITRHKFNHFPELEYSCVYASTDNGKTFTLRGYIDDPDTTFDENTLAELPDGTLLSTTRDEAAISISESTDGGYTWSTPRKLMDHVSSRSYLSTFPSGNVLLVTNDPEGLDEGRSRMTAFLSKDGGKTFPHKLLLYKEPNVSYPAGIVMEDGKALVSFDRNRYTDSEMYMSCFTEEDIIAGKCVTEGSYAAKLIFKADEAHGGAEKIFEDGTTW